LNRQRMGATLTLETRRVEIIKKMSCSRRWVFHSLLLCLIPLCMGCHYRQDTGTPAQEGKVVFERIAVAPFQQIVPEGTESGGVRCPICGSVFTATKAAGRPEAVVEAHFLEQLQKSKPKLSIISGERVAGVYRQVSTSSLKTPLRQVLQDVGRELGAEGIVAGYVYRFRERKGESYTVERPASVAFEIHLLRVEDGVLVWRGAFDRTQSSLMEDLLQILSFYREKGRWVTAEELAEEGLEQVLKTFPGLP
jgi:hypothetical protein